MKIAVQKNHLVGQILYRSLVPPKKTTSMRYEPCIIFARGVGSNPSSVASELVIDTHQVLNSRP